MKKLYFLVKWGKYGKQKTWSGVCWELFKALGKYYNIQEICLKYSSPSILGRFLIKIFGSDIWYHEIMYNRKLLSSQISQEHNCIVFQFEEILLDTDFRKTYIFQDCSVSYIYYLKKYQSNIFKNSDFQDHNGFYIRKRKEIQNEYYNQCAGIFTLSNWFADDLITRCKICPEKVHVVGAGINIDSNRINDSQKKGNKILFIGRSFKRKGGDLVLSAFKELRKRHPDVELYVAGPKDNPTKTILSGFHYLGECDKDRIIDLFNMCDVFCMPSYFEAFGIAFIEALTFGLPVIGRNVCEMPYIIEEGKSGFLLKEDNPQELTALMELALNSQEMKDYVKSKREFYMTEYSWDKVVNRIAKIIGE